MGTVMIGGMLASIFFTFVFTPVAFWYVYKFRRFYIKSWAARRRKVFVSHVEEVK